MLNYKYSFIHNKYKTKFTPSNSLEAIIEEDELDDDNNVDEEIQSLDEQDEATEHTTPETSNLSTGCSGVQYVLVNNACDNQKGIDASDVQVAGFMVALQLHG